MWRSALPRPSNLFLKRSPPRTAAGSGHFSRCASLLAPHRTEHIPLIRIVLNPVLERGDNLLRQILNVLRKVADKFKIYFFFHHDYIAIVGLANNTRRNDSGPGLQGE